MNQSILRATVASGELIPMTEWAVTNRLPQYGFKVAANEATEKTTMKDLDDSKSPCAAYSEGTSSYDAAGKWRVPNVIELAMMTLSGSALKNGMSSSNIISCTKFSWAYRLQADPSVTYSTPQTTGGYWYGNNDHHYLWYNGSTITLGNTNYTEGRTTKDNVGSQNVRCVRDIQPGE